MITTVYRRVELVEVLVLEDAAVRLFVSQLRKNAGSAPQDWGRELIRLLDSGPMTASSRRATYVDSVPVTSHLLW